MPIIVLECENVDSCEPGQTHKFPEVGSRVTAKTDGYLPIRGTHHYLRVGAGDVGTVECLLPDAHQAGVMFTDLESLVVWCDIEDDIHFC